MEQNQFSGEDNGKLSKRDKRYRISEPTLPQKSIEAGSVDQFAPMGIISMKHPYSTACTCKRCNREKVRRQFQQRTIPDVMLDWTHSKNRRRARIAREYWDAY